MKTNKLILGTVQFGLPYGINNISGQIKIETAFKILATAEKSGVQYLDTAAAYGKSEEIIGQYLSKSKTSNFKIITKFSFQNGATCEQSLLHSLEKLMVDCVDTIMFHSYADYYKHKSVISDFVKTYKNKLFHNLGVSVYTNQEVDLIIDDINVNIVQLPFNLLDNNTLRLASLKKLKNAGKVVHVRSAFLQGLFIKELSQFPESLSDLQQPIQFLKSIAAENHVSIQKLAFSYACNNLLIDNILIGVDNLKQLHENLSFLDFELNQGTLSEIDSIKIENESLLNPSKWKI